MSLGVQVYTCEIINTIKAINVSITSQSFLCPTFYYYYYYYIIIIVIIIIILYVVTLNIRFTFTANFKYTVQYC